jgi:hypothetical protein
MMGDDPQEPLLPFDWLSIRRLIEFPLAGLQVNGIAVDGVARAIGHGESTFLTMKLARVALFDGLIHGTAALTAETSITARSITGRAVGEGTE